MTDRASSTRRNPGSIPSESRQLEPEPPADLQAIQRAFLNGWHLENARIGTTREVPV